MNKILIKSIILVLIVNCNDSIILKPKQVTLQEVVEKSDLSEGSGFHSLQLKFTKPDKFEFYYSSEGWNWLTKGNYQIKDSKLVLIANFCEDNFGKQNCNDSFGNGHCNISKNQQSIEYLYKLDCYSDNKFIIFSTSDEKSNLISFDIKEFKINPNTELSYSNIPIVTLGNIQGKVLEPVVLREGPGIDFKKLDYIVNNYDGPFLSSLPKDETVIIHARTREKKQVKNWNNYWLLISSADSNKVWVFSEFISY
ncbi:SH3 domain-containing protein [Leptospira congkakensis]|nr:SH3 domain-containing protein [Leptospira congkakensis]